MLRSGYMYGYSSNIRISDNEKYNIGRVFYKFLTQKRYTVKLYEIENELMGRIEPDRMMIILKFINDITPEERIKILKIYYRKLMRERSNKRRNKKCQ